MMRTCELYPPINYSNAIARRLGSASRLETDPLEKSTALILCETSPAFFVNEFVWTYDPREHSPFIPFDLYEDQEKALEWLKDLLERGKDGVLEKSRDMGATWLTAAFAVWCLLFKRGSAVGFGSRKLELVDKIGDPKCIFEKIRFILRNLPPWLINARAPGFDPAKHDNFCKIINPANGSSITGEGGDEIGRGGRTTIYFVDEAAFLPRPQLVDQALSANSRCKVYVSTPRGANNPFATKRLSGRYPVFTLHWKNDPRKTAWAVVPVEWEGVIDSDGELLIGEPLKYGLGVPPEPPEGFRVIYPWYEELCLKEDPITVAQEYDIDYSASLEGVVIPAKWLRACVGLALPRGMAVAGYDVAAGGSAENALILRAGPVVESIIRWREEDPTQAAFKVVRHCEAAGIRRLFFDSIGVGAGTAGAIKLVRRALKFTFHGINVGTSPTETIWPDRQKSKEKFVNLKAELWWRLRTRVEKTYQFAILGISHPLDELLSLPPGPDTEALISQLSGVRYFDNEAGKIIVESKKQLAERGVASPDIAEALILSFSPLKTTTAPTRSASARGVKVAPGTNHQLIEPRKGRRGNSA